MEFGLFLIPLLLVMSGVIAYIGNLVGRNIGRRRLSIFGLRPRHTAQLITVLSGMLITVFTLVTVLALSESARVALFRLNQLRQEIREQEVRLRRLQVGEIAYLADQEVLRTIIDGRQPLDSVRRQVNAFWERASEIALANGAGPDVNSREVLKLTPPGVRLEQIAAIIKQRNTEVVFRLVAAENTVKGLPLKVTPIWFPNDLVYRKGTVLLQGVVDGRRSRDEVGNALLRLIDSAALRAKGKVISPPFTLVSAGPDVRADFDQVRATVTRIVATRRQVPVVVKAAKDIYTIGPIEVELEVLER
ncbi:MAG: DUF3084 domain-containing protein [Armatimonadota bacterium]|nr:DUF3084 domain-containing protein [Armatimonadota bacterium]